MYRACVCMRCKLCDGLLACEGCICPALVYMWHCKMLEELRMLWLVESSSFYLWKSVWPTSCASTVELWREIWGLKCQQISLRDFQYESSLISLGHFIKERTCSLYIVELFKHLGISKNTWEVQEAFAYHSCSSRHFSCVLVTVFPVKPWTPEISMECYCVSSRKPITREKTKPQTVMVIR